MAPKRVLRPLPIFDPDALESFDEKTQVKHAANIWKYLLTAPKASVDNIENVPGLPKALVEPSSRHSPSSQQKFSARRPPQRNDKLLVELQDVCVSKQ